MGSGILLKYTFILLAHAVVFSVAVRRICYYNLWALYEDRGHALRPENVDAYLCQHITIAYFAIDDTGTKLRLPEDQWELTPLRKLIRHVRSLNDDINVVAAVGGWDHDNVIFHKMLATKDSRQTFVTNAIRFLRKHDFDGLHIDFQFIGTRGSTQEDRNKYFELLRLIRDEFAVETTPDDKWTMTQSISVNPKPEDADWFDDVNRYASKCNWVEFPLFDLNGIKESPLYAKHHSPLYSQTDINNVNSLAQYWIKKGLSRHKFVLGLSFKGRAYKLLNPRNRQLGAPAKKIGGNNGAGYSVREICRFIKQGAKEVIDPETRSPYMVVGDELITYDNPQSVRTKAKLVADNRLGGISMFSMNYDDHSGSCSPGHTYPLANAVLDGLNERREYEAHIKAAISGKEHSRKIKAEVLRQRNEGWLQQDIAEGKPWTLNKRH